MNKRVADCKIGSPFFKYGFTEAGIHYNICVGMPSPWGRCPWPAGPDEGRPCCNCLFYGLPPEALPSSAACGRQLLPREKPWEDTTMRYRTLDKNWQFNRVYGRGKSYVHPHCVLYVAKNRLGYTRIGLTATKKVGHAVQRNRARRIMRAALSEHLSQNIGGYDIILVARARTPYLKSTQLSKTLAAKAATMEETSVQNAFDL